ncbi:primosomal protein N' [Planctomycetota bacterium]
MKYAQIALNIGVFSTFTYSIPDNLAHKVKPGSYVAVPFGRQNRITYGFCVELTDIPVKNIKAIRKTAYDQPLFTPDMLSICRWISEYYECPLGEVLAGIIPPGIRHNVHARIQPSYKLKKTCIEDLKRAPKQREVVEYLMASAPGPVLKKRIEKATGCSSSVIKSLEKKGFLERVVTLPKVEIPIGLEGTDIEELTIEQKKADGTISDFIDADAFKVILIDGITGSGKTELYIRAIENVLSKGRSTILLVPEIVLTPQMNARFSSRFDRVAIIHSRLSEGERAAIWSEIKKGMFDVVIGPRSALFSPLPNIGLIIIDEEHEHTFKQESAPRYHARDLAVMMGSIYDIPVILGSATPSLESLRNAGTGKYQVVTLSKRVAGYQLPQMHIINMAKEFAEKHRYKAISLPLAKRIEQTLSRDEQAILFINQRGFSRFIHCPLCGKSVRCPHCDITLTFHKQNRFLCHYCGHSKEAFTKCPECSFTGLKRMGSGTQKIEEKLNSYFPHAVIHRVDSDSMSSKKAYRTVLTKFAANEINILVGTQIVAKGLDFPNVTTVGVLGIENILNLPDFRSPERTFQMISQVSGRAGRGSKEGHVFLEVFDPDHYAIECAAAHNNKKFYSIEESFRKELSYPPFGSLVRIIIEGPENKQASKHAHKILSELKHMKFPRKVIILGPAEAPLSFINNRYRYHIILKVPDKVPRNGLFRSHDIFEAKKGIKITVDVDPLSML